MAAVGAVVLVAAGLSRGNAWHVVSFSVFAASALLLYLMSTLYHAIRSPRAKRVFKVLDHASIYVLIAGTYTPFALVALRPGVGWWIFGIVWGAALLGIALEPFRTRQTKILTSVAYVAMGWIVVFAWKPLAASVGADTLWFLMGGGLAYTLGVAFYAGKASWSHPVWHLFVGAGTILHFFAVLSLLP